MRKYLRLILPLSLVGVGTFGAGACGSSSSGNSDLFDGGPDVTATDSQSGTDTSVADSAKDTSVADTSVPFDSGPPHDAQAACAVVPATDGGDAAAVDGEAGATMGNVEVEPNDTAATASTLVLNGPECGSISPATDVDYYKFTLPANATTWSISFDGNIKMTFTVLSDAPVVIQPGNTPSPNFHAGAEYTVKVESNDGQPQAYSITITES